MFDQFHQWIKEATIITIFRHENPDLDALGSQFGLKQWLCDNFPTKKIYACGFETRSDFLMDNPSHLEIQESLAIVLDTPSLSRVDDSRFQEAYRKVKIDHHPQIEQFSDLEFVDTSRAATCEYITDIIYRLIPNSIRKKTAEYLFKGILTDTLSFKTNSTTENTFLSASRLAKTGINISEVTRAVFDLDLKTFQFITYLRSKLETLEGNIGYAILSIEEIEQFGISPDRARSLVAEFRDINELQVWCLFTQINRGIDSYKGSLRSKSINLIEIAEIYGGGGHKNACGVKNLTLVKINEILTKISKSLKN